MRNRSFVTILLFAAACQGTPPRDPLAHLDLEPQLAVDLGDFHRPIATDVEQAQRLFDLGLMWTYAFHHDEAVRCFRAAQRHDPECAMAFWGEAFALGPNINAPLTDATIALAAHTAAQRAHALGQGERPANRALIEAVVRRYAAPVPDDRAPLDAAFADAMVAAWREFPNDPDIGSLYAESLLDLHPWQTWSKTGDPLFEIETVVATLERVFELRLDHPLANHLYIHAMEASSEPEKAVPAADRLGAFAPDAGHLVHMPAHIYINVGRYRDAEEANRRAIEADRAYFARVGPQGIYEFYRAHNHHFLVYAAMFAGRSESAIRSARELISDLPEHAFTEMAAAVDGFLAVPLHAMIRFGKWRDVLAEPEPAERFVVARALRHYARGIAFAALGEVEAALREQAEFERARELVGEDAVIGINPAPPVMVVAQHMLAGEIAYRRGEFETAFAQLRLAAAAEDALRYDEPSPWMMPVRHALGALLLEQGRVAEAETAFREDLERHPENGWSLHGLAQCAKRRGAAADAEGYGRRFDVAFADADFELTAACFCSVAAGAAACHER